MSTSGNVYHSGVFQRWVEQSKGPIGQFLKQEVQYLKKYACGYDRLLDVGCGYGRDLSYLAKCCRRVVGVDSDKVMVGQALRNLKGMSNAQVCKADARNLPFADSTFDIIICTTNTFGNFGRFKIPILREMKRVLRPPGKILVSVYSESALQARLESYRKAGVPIRKIVGTTMYISGVKSEQFTKKQLREVFSKAGLQLSIKPLTRIGCLCVAADKNLSGT